MASRTHPDWFLGTGSRTVLDLSGPAFALSVLLHLALLLIVIIDQPGADPVRGAPRDVAVTLAAPGAGPGEAADADGPSEGNQLAPSEGVVTGAAPASTAAPIASGGAIATEATAGGGAVATDTPEAAAEESWRAIADFGTVPLPMFPPPMLSWGSSVVLVMQLHVRPDGTVERVEVVRSSGFPSLDDAALEAAMVRRFAAADARVLERKVVFFDEHATARKPGF